jgi:hypothetical protein
VATKKKASSKSSRSKKHAKRETKQDTCFIIMPFGEWFDFYHDTIYVPAIKASGLIPKRADDLYRPSAIVNDIWALTQEAKLILADLSGKNPNVFYELGMAHAVAKPAILVTESMDDVPFDLRSLRVIVYEKNMPNWGDVLREKIEISIREILASPLESVLPTFIKVKETSTQPTASKVEKDLISLKQDVDMLKRESQSRESAGSTHRPSRSRLSEALEYARDAYNIGLSEDTINRRLKVRFGYNDDAARIIMKKAKLEVAAESKLSSSSVESEDEET